MRRWPGVLAWALWALTLLGIPVVIWLDHLVGEAGKADLSGLSRSSVALLALVSAPTVGALLAGRRPRHPVGWLLLTLALSLATAGVTWEYAIYGLLARPGRCPPPRMRSWSTAWSSTRWRPRWGSSCC